MEEMIVIRKLLPENGKNFPASKNINVICGKTFARTNKWWKAMLLIKTSMYGKERYQLRLYGWQKNKNGEYKTKQKFNVSVANYIADLIDVLYIFSRESGRGKVIDRIYEKLVKRIDEIENAKNLLEKKKSEIPQMKKKLKVFRKMLDSRINERAIHKFLKHNTWMFGTGYKRLSKSEKSMTIHSRYDFLLQRSDKYFDIVELKSPKADLFVNIHGKKRAMSKELKDAMSQTMQYLAEARKYYLTLKDQTGFDIYFPEGIIVIGRRKGDQREILKIHNEFLNKVKIWTYDDLLDTAAETIKTFQKGGKT